MKRQTSRPFAAELAQNLTAAGDHEIDAPIYCVITRFGLKSARHLLPTLRQFRAVSRAADRSAVPGLLKFAFLIENLRACYSLSLWSQEPRFSAHVPEHIDAASEVFGSLAYDQERGPELWSTTWRLDSVTNNLNWDELNLRQIILSQEQRMSEGTV